MRTLARVLPLSLVAVMLCTPGATPVATAATVEVKMLNGSFSPGVAYPGLGGTIQWTNGSGETHTAMSKQMFFYPQLDGGGTEAFIGFEHAGTFPYYCVEHPKVVGSIKVPLKAAREGGGFRLRWSSVGSFTGDRSFDVQKNPPGADTGWSALRTNTTSRSALLDPTRKGTWRYRARTDNVSAGLSSGWSPEKSVTVS
jgi:plastocyanin